MIDEKIIKAILTGSPPDYSLDECVEVLNLIRIGLWAKEHGIPALRKIDEPDKYHHLEPDDYTRAGCFQFVAHEALKALPKEEE